MSFVKFERRIALVIKRRLLERPGIRMTTCAVVDGIPRELPRVRIGVARVARRWRLAKRAASRVGTRTPTVAFHACGRCMFTVKLVTGPQAVILRAPFDLSETRRAVTPRATSRTIGHDGPTRLVESAIVNIAMTLIAFRRRRNEPDESGCVRLVTEHACNRVMGAGQREAALIVMRRIKLAWCEMRVRVACDALPLRRAISELATVRILVAGHAFIGRSTGEQRRKACLQVRPSRECRTLTELSVAIDALSLVMRRSQRESSRLVQFRRHECKLSKE